MLTLEQFRVRFPEFGNVSAPTVTAKLAEAEVQIASDVFGEQTDAAHGYLTAHLLLCAPMGHSSRQKQKDGRTTYGDQWERLRDAAVGGLRIL